ncbi:hypothetical protein [Solitalea koreensis]|uniref:Uncharacterized protein n=1 Tax=Solitalea koreensis TaxID=543615 RepID=A0A521CZY8_9SPHI|nr:hypothetical protein [Solitalea koreensis]SMO64994.1 hypothetical protein SAMN06265350_10570 [Solitalea koreensis]
MNNDKGHIDLNDQAFKAEAGSPFTVPTGYFNSLYSRIILRLDPEQPSDDSELNSLEFFNEKTFTAPTDYFDSLADRIQARINIEEKETTLNIPGLVKENPFKVPDGYFKSFEERVQNKLLGNDEERELAITGLSKDLPFTVPGEYFDQLGYRIEEKLGPELAKSEFKIATKLFIRRFYKVAAAAIVVGFISWLSIQEYNGQQFENTKTKSNTVVQIGNKNFDVSYFEEEMLVDELLKKTVSINGAQDKLKANSLENYIINNVDEDLLLQEL